MSEGKTLDELIKENKASNTQTKAATKRTDGKQPAPGRKVFGARKQAGKKPGAPIGARRQGRFARGGRQQPQNQGRGGV